MPVRVQPGPRPRAPRPPFPRVVPTPEGDFWQASVQQLVEREAVTALVRELALQAQLVARDEGHWMLRVERESLNQPPAATSCRPRCSRGPSAVSLTVEVGPVTDSPARREAAARRSASRRPSRSS